MRSNSLSDDKLKRSAIVRYPRRNLPQKYKVQENTVENLNSKRYHLLLVNLDRSRQATSKTTPEDIEDVQRIFHANIDSAAEIYKGNIVKNVDDSYLITFQSATLVLRAGLKIESDVYRHNNRDGKKALDIKIVISTDEMIASNQWDEAFARTKNLLSGKEKSHNGNGHSQGPVLSLNVKPEREPVEFFAALDCNEQNRLVQLLQAVASFEKWEEVMEFSPGEAFV